MSAEGNDKSIIRVHKKENPYFMADKFYISDKRLSWKAKGLLTYAFSKPDNWKIIVQDLINQSTDGRDSVYAGLKELKKYGYLEERAIREKGKIIGFEKIIYERPIQEVCITECNTKSDNEDFFNTLRNTYVKPQEKPLTEKPEVANKQNSSPLPGFPDTEKPDTENPTLLNNDLTNDFDLNKKEDAHKIAVELQRFLCLDYDLAISMAIAGLKKYPIEEFFSDLRIYKFCERYKSELSNAGCIQSPEGFFLKTFDFFVGDTDKKERWRKQNFKILKNTKRL